MKTLKDYLPDIERYFKYDCYCPNEVYSVDGFGYLLVYADAPAKLLDKGYCSGDVWLFETMAGDEPILLNVWIDGDKVVETERYEVSKDNIYNIKKFIHNNNYSFKLTESDKLAKSVKKILSMADAAIID